MRGSNAASSFSNEMVRRRQGARPGEPQPEPRGTGRADRPERVRHGAGVAIIRPHRLHGAGARVCSGQHLTWRTALTAAVQPAFPAAGGWGAVHEVLPGERHACRHARGECVSCLSVSRCAGQHERDQCEHEQQHALLAVWRDAQRRTGHALPLSTTKMILLDHDATDGIG